MLALSFPASYGEALIYFPFFMKRSMLFIGLSLLFRSACSVGGNVADEQQGTSSSSSAAAVQASSSSVAPTVGVPEASSAAADDVPAADAE